jgi:glutamyl-tRNA reductase
LDARRDTGDPHYGVEGIRAHEVGRLFNKISLSPEQRKAIEDLSHSLVEELVHGPIAETIALVQEPSESADSGGRDCVVEGEQVARAQQPRPSDRRTFWRIF